MADVNVILLFDSFFGSRGSGNSNFDYPAGICATDDKLFIVDKQNSRIKIHDLTGAFISEFGSFGTGNNNFSFPEGIATDDTYLYIVDSANHRIKVHDLTGVYVSEFGSNGSGNNNFDYPVGIAIYNGNLWIADKQNGRVKEHTTAGVFVREITGFNFPEGVAAIDDKIVVSNSGDKEIKFYTPLGSFLFNADHSFDYPTIIKETNGVLTVLEKQNNKLVFLNEVGTFISEFGEEGSGIDEFFFPYDLSYYDDKVYVVDSANHRIAIYDFTVEQDVPIYADEILDLTKQLYPTGRAWWMPKNSIFEKIHLGLAYSESRTHSATREILDSILPDNDTFSEADAVRWEQALALITPENVDLEDRKEAILRKMQFPGSVPARQHYLFIQGELQKAGFAVYVHENRFGDPPAAISLSAAIYDQINYDQVTYGFEGYEDATTIANHIEEEKDEDFNFGNIINARATFFIGGPTFPNRAEVDPDRKKEFRELILKMKPAQTAGILLIDYIKPEGVEYDLIEDTQEVY